MNKNILMLTIGFRPNVGGIETHFEDFLNETKKYGIYTTVLTYQPLTSNVKAPFKEAGKDQIIYRLPIIKGLFYKLVSSPILEFVYLLPGLFLGTFFILLTKKIDVIHAHGLVAGFVGVFWGKLFGKRVIISTHSIYNFPKRGVYRLFAEWIFQNASFCLTLSNQSKKEILDLGVDPNQVKTFTYWVDLGRFKPLNKDLIKKKLGWENQFVVLFVGRLIRVKGLEELLASAKSLKPPIQITIIGEGTLQDEVKKAAAELEIVKFLGKIDNEDLPIYYNGADLLIVPSINEEGFGRVILESLACGTPVIGSKRGAIPEAMDESVGKLIDITANNLKETIKNFYENQGRLKKMQKLAREYALKKYSAKNAQTIIKTYE